MAGTSLGHARGSRSLGPSGGARGERKNRDWVGESAVDVAVVVVVVVLGVGLFGAVWQVCSGAKHDQTRATLT